jgi:hypothetical protein
MRTFVLAASLVAGGILGAGSSLIAEKGGNACPGRVVANWKVDGVSYPASTAMAMRIGDAWQLTLIECRDDGADRTLQFAGLPAPLAVGRYALTVRILHGSRPQGAAGASFSATGGGAISADTNYFTDATHTGTLEVTRIDAKAKTFDASFSFTAVNDAGTGIVKVTAGRITAARAPG